MPSEKILEAKKKIEDELEKTKAERDSLKSQVPKGEKYTQLSDVDKRFSDQSEFYISGNSFNRKSGSAWNTITFGPVLRTVCILMFSYYYLSLCLIVGIGCSSIVCDRVSPFFHCWFVRNLRNIAASGCSSLFFTLLI